MDRRLTSDIFRHRLAELHTRSGLRQSAFAAQLGIDRSALSQLMNGAGARLPRADTLVALAETHQVSVDWLLGLSEDQGVASETRDMLEIAGGADTIDQSPLAQWHEEARGAKIRYVPSGLPDMLRTDLEPAHDPGQFRRAYLQRPETDMEVAMPLQRLQELAFGQGVWAEQSREQRKLHLETVEQMLDAFYPRLRLYLFDGSTRFSMAYTVFGHQRVAVYAGEIYLLLNGRQTIQTMVDHFDNLVKVACVHAHEASDFVADLIGDLR
jgi:transcriptional regulator with XRE-family HTH domain